MGRSSLRHNREIQGIDSAGELPAQYGEKYNNRTDANGDPVPNPNNPALNPPTFFGPIPDQVGNVSVAFSLQAGSYFSGGVAPVVYTVSAGTLPSQLSINASTGEISGTPDTVETQAGIVVTATDANLDTADSNAFEIDVLA